MSDFGRYESQPREPRAEHEKGWLRSKAIAWDARWQALSVGARRAYLFDIKPPTKEGSVTQPATLLEKVSAQAVEELTKAGFVEVESRTPRKGAKVVPIRSAYDFSARLRSMQRYQLLGRTDRVQLANYVHHAFQNRGETTITGVLANADMMDYCKLEEGLDLYVTTRLWPVWALESCKTKAARPVLEALRKAPGPIKLTALPSMVAASKPQDVYEALTDLIAHLVAFEDVDPETFELIVGLLPEVKNAEARAKEPRKRPPLVICKEAKEVGSAGGLEVGDLRIFLLEIASNSPRLRRDGGVFQKDEPRFLQALPPLPPWLEEAMKVTIEQRLDVAYAHAKVMKLVEVENDDKTAWLRLTGKGRAWLSATIEEQYAKVYEHYRSTSKKQPYSYDESDVPSFGDGKFFGVAITFNPHASAANRYYHYRELSSEQRAGLRAAFDRAFQKLAIGVFYRWDSVLDHLSFAEHNPLLGGMDAAKVSIVIDRRPIPRVAEQVEAAGKMVLDIFLKLRLLPLDAVKGALDADGNFCVARLPRCEGYFGRPYEWGEDEAQRATRVIVQPDFSVLVIGLDPRAAAELAPFCERAGGHVGQGALTFKITRSSVIRAASQGLSGPAIAARLVKHASVEVPTNVLKEVEEWANWVRLVNLRAITVVRCPDSETVARVVSALGKKAERLGGTLVALHVPKLLPADRQKLQDHGIIVTKADLMIPPDPPATSVEEPTPKKRGRPRKKP